MAGEWIKMRGNLWDDPRVGRIVDMTGTKEATVIGALYWLWATADQHTEDGCMPGLSMQQIDRKTGVKGFAAALVDVGWLVDDAHGVRVASEDNSGDPLFILVMDRRPTGAAWARARDVVFLRDGRRCTYCGVADAAMECDHVYPLALGGSNDLENLTTACRACNRSKGSKPLQQWRWH